MKRHIKYPSIDDFRQTVKKIQDGAKGHWDEDKNEFVRNPFPKFPVIKASATEKIHGTNAGVCYSKPDGFWVQGRKIIIEPGVDNAACAMYAMQNQEAWMTLVDMLAEEYGINLDTHIISIYYEWCGSGIQKNTAVEGIDKKIAIVFRHFKVSLVEPDDDVSSKWYETKVNDVWIDDQDNDIFNISNFPSYEFEIDFANPLASQNVMVDTVLNIIEPNSPVGQRFGKDGNIGEGMVVSFLHQDNLLMFKVKGEKHSGKSKVKVLKKVDDVKVQKIQDIAQKVSPRWRLEQMFTEANDLNNDQTPDVRNMGKFLKLLNNDIIKEETDVIVDAGLVPKEIFKSVSMIARQYYQDKLDEVIMGT